MTFSERVRRIGLPTDQLVVIGSGLLEQLNIRTASDIDIVVSLQLFARLKDIDGFQLIVDERGEHFVKDDVEVWQDWPPKSYAELAQTSQNIDGISFVATDFLIQKKLERGTDKDIEDVASLKEYYGQ